MHRFGRILLLAVVLAAPAARAQERSWAWKDVARIVAVGDVHGDYGQLVACLRRARVIDGQNRWIGGRTHLVQAGDIFDRGPESKQAMDLLMALEPQAEQAGGRVHALLGNHEAMILAGQYGYLHADEPAPYGGMDAFERAMTPEGRYGRWIRGRPAVIQINDILFLHAGLSAGYAALPLPDLNARVARSLGPEGSGAADDPEGPLWYRGLAIGEEDEVREVLDIVRRAHGARHIVVGHTVTPPPLGIKTRAGGGVIMIDVGLSRTYRGGPAMFLLVENGRFLAVSEDASVDLGIGRTAVAPVGAPPPEPVPAEKY